MASYTFRMPDIGEGIVEAEIVAWHVQVGDFVQEDAPLADVMTDKATVEMTSPVSGRVLRMNCAVGEKVVIGSEFVVFSTDAEDTLAVNVGPESVPSTEKPRLRVTPDVALDPKIAEEIENESAVEDVTATLASPAVRRHAKELGVALTSVRGTGPKGRVTHSDLNAVSAVAAARAPTSPAKPLEIPLTGLRRIIADRLVESKRSIPHFTYVEEVDITELEMLRQHLNATGKEGYPRLSLLHFILLGVCRSVLRWPQCNAHFDDSKNSLTQYPVVHLGVATMTDDGLVVPVVHDAQALNVWELSEAVTRLAADARAKRLSRDKLTGSTITVTSLGPLAGVVSTPIINRPETAIIGPNRMTEKVVLQQGNVVVRRVMNLSSSFDHRIVDGRDAALMIQHLKAQLEHPATLFL